MSTKNNLIFGLHPVLEALKSGKEIEKVFLQNGSSGPLFNELKKELTEKKIVFQFVPQEKLNRLTSKTHQGVACYVSEIEYQKIEDILPNIYEKGEVPLILMLDRITDVRNYGAICRTAECAGVHAVIVPLRGGAQANGDAIKTSAGAMHNIALCRSNNMKDTIRLLKESGLQAIACTEKSDKMYTKQDYNAPTLLIMGSEENGISDEYLKLCDERIKIPLLGEISSLNVSVATGVVLYEVIRQRQINF